MADIVSSEKRSQMMAGIKGTNTKPEIVIRKALYRLGFRYRLHVKNLPGKPDIVFNRYKAVIFINGCFWHGHDCHLFKLPSTRPEFWKIKIARNQEVDSIAINKLLSEGWRVGVIWECSIRGKNRRPLEYVIGETAAWILSVEKFYQIRDSS